MPTVEIAVGESIGVIDLFFNAGLGASKGDIRRLIQGGGASIDDVKVTDVYQTFTPDMAKDGEVILRAGKKNYKRVLIK